MIFNNDFGGMNGLGGMGGGYGGNGGGYGNGYRRGNYINSDYCGLGSFSSPNPLGVPMRVGGYFDSGSLYGGYGSMNMQNVGTYLMLEQLMEHSNHNNNNNYITPSASGKNEINNASGTQTENDKYIPTIDTIGGDMPVDTTQKDTERIESITDEIIDNVD